MKGQLPVPLSPEDFKAMKFDRRYLMVEWGNEVFAWRGPWPRRISWDWYRADRGWCRYSEWWADVRPFGLSIVADYGIPGQQAVVTSPRTKDGCREHLVQQILNMTQSGMDPGNLMMDDWE